MIKHTLLLLLALSWPGAAPQYIGEEKLNALQKTAVIDGERRDLDQIGSVIFTNRTTTNLNCASGFMDAVVNFTEPFYGVIYPNGSRTSPCLTHGLGGMQYSLKIPLKGCNTKTVDRRVFVNNIIVRFHKKLELEIDEVKTIICRYPSPVVLQAPALPRIFVTPATPRVFPKPIGEFEILMIFCAIVFLALLLVGMACSYTCLKKRNIRIIRHRPLSSAPSEISKISEPSLMFGEITIPRAHATSTSDSDTAFVSQSETLPSDYPSESPTTGSDIEEVDVQEDRLSSVYSDALVQSEAETFSPEVILKPPKPTFMVRVKKALTPPRTPEPDYPIQSALSQSLTTILERDESFRGSRPGSERAYMLTESEEDYNPPPALIPPPEFSEVSTVHKAPVIDVHHVESVQMLKQEITDVEETIERGKRRYLVPREPSEPDSDYPSEVRSVPDLEEMPLTQRMPDMSSHMVDDRYLSTLTETHVTEDVEKHRRFIKQYHMKPKPLPPPKWNVAIRHYPGPRYADEVESSGPEWEAYSEPGSDVFRAQMLDGIDDRLSQIDVETMEHPPPPNWRVLLRVLEPPTTEQAITEYLSVEDREKWRQIITTESTLRTMLTTATVREDYERIRRDQRYEKLFESKKWDVIIRILSPPQQPQRRRDLETSSEAPSASDTDSAPLEKQGKRPKRISLPPPVEEYDADGNPIIKRSSGAFSSRSRRSSKSSLVSGNEVRSLAETEVNFSHVVRSSWSGASSPTSPDGRRSHAEVHFRIPDDPDTDFDDRLSGRTARSLARSASEFTEDWRHPDRFDRYSESSVDSKPHRQCERSTSEYLEEAPHLSDFPSSPDGSPQMGVRRYPVYDFQGRNFDQAVVPSGVDSNQVSFSRREEGQFQHSSEVVGQRMVHREVHTTHQSSSGGFHLHSGTHLRDDDDEPVSKF